VPSLAARALGSAARAPYVARVTAGWKERLDDPLNRFYRYPLARLLVRFLLETPVSANAVSLVEPLLAAAAAFLITFPDRVHLTLGALLFELRSVLDCVDGTLARARGTAKPAGHAVDAIADWLGTAFLYAGIFWHLRLHPPPEGFWSHHLSVGSVLLLALAQGALRSFAADYYKRKYTAIFEEGRDGTVDDFITKARSLAPSSSLLAQADVWILRVQHLIFERERGGPELTRPRTSYVEVVRARETSILARAVAHAWSVSNGDAFLSLVTLSILAGRLWEAQLFFAIAGLPWILAVLAMSARLDRAA
jgi:phosphatidylglycerophosphate synthase